MQELDLQRLLLNIFIDDKLRNKKHTIFSQLTVIIIKSLIPSRKFAGNVIDYARLKKEIELLKYYKIDENKQFSITIEEELYFKHEDNTLYARLLPIIISNKDYNIIEDEVIKNTLHTTGNIEILLEWLAISKYIFLYIEKQENIIDDLRQYIINFSQLEFLEKYRDEYRWNVLKPSVGFKINFEKTKVSLISLLHGVDLEQFKNLKDILGLSDGKEAKTSIGRIFRDSKRDKNICYEIENLYKRMAIYMLKLRKSRIDPDDLKIQEYILPDIFKFKEGEMFFHSLLNNSKVIKKEIKDDILISLIQTKTGAYLFKSDPFN